MMFLRGLTMENKKMFVPEQEEVINSCGKNLIVSASAGSGKTTVMIKKIFNHISSGDCHVDELLVLTYTKSSANDMKRKLVDALRQNENEIDFLGNEIELLPSSDICTFDSFCQKIVKKYFYILNIDPTFSILQGGEQNFQQNTAMNIAIKEFRKNHTEEYELLLENYSPKRNEEKIKEIILEIHNYLTSLVDIEEFIKKTQNFYKKEKKIAEKIIIFHYFSIFKEVRRELEVLKNEALIYNFTKYIAYINNLIFQLDYILKNAELNKILEYIKCVSYGILRREKEDEAGINEKIAYQKCKLKLAVDEMLCNYISSEIVENSYENCGRVASALINLERVFCEKYSNIKKSINCYDFNDVERLTIKLLENEDVREEIKKSYKYIFVDEFQDANGVQEKIVFSLDNNNLFFVGDTKQSIYAFRQSDPKIFLNIQKRFEESEIADAKTLNSNFRTNENILYFVNYIFNTIMTERTAGVNYEKDAQFVPKASYEDIENEICVSLNIINKLDNDKVEKPTEIYDLKKHKKTDDANSKHDDQCKFICNKISELIGTPIYDKEIGKRRPIDYEDITILILRRGEFLNCLTKNFEKLGIPYIVPSSNNLEECYDNMVLYNLIRLANNSKDDYALYSVLSSNLFDFSDEELAEIRIKILDNEYFYQCLEEYNLPGKILEKIKKFYSRVQDFRFCAKYNGLYFALSKIIKESNYLLKMGEDDDFETRKLNIEQFIDSFSSSKFNYDISEYILYREASFGLEKTQIDNTGLNAVQITTMHSSKGLEYPVVILPNLEADFLKSPGGHDIKINQDVGIGVKSYNYDERSVYNGIFYDAVKLKNRDIDISEKIRLLYVAMTRAKNKLILVGNNAKNYNKINGDYDIKKCSNYLGLIVGAIGEELVEKVNNGEIFSQTLFNNSKMEMSTMMIEAINFNGKSVVIPSPKDEDVSSILKQQLLMELPKHEAIALKNSVSELAFDTNSSINFAPKEFKINENLLENASKEGVVFHKILEEIDFNSIEGVFDVENYIKFNLNEEELSLINQVSPEQIFSNICLIKKHIDNNSVLLKEQKFVMCLPYNEIMGGDIKEKVLIQGIIDLVIINKDEIILIDYKLSRKKPEELKQKYRKQIELYEMALKKKFVGKKINKYILCLNSGLLIDI